MYRPAYLPLSTLRIGAYGPNPLIPSCTIVPDVTATSVTCEPQALLTVPISTPWSSFQLLGSSTREEGCSGKTQADEEPVGVPPATPTTPPPRFAPPEPATAARVATVWTAVRRIEAVFGPTMPLACSLCARWNDFTARAVLGPKVLLACIRYPVSVSQVWSVLTSWPTAPIHSVRVKLEYETAELSKPFGACGARTPAPPEPPADAVVGSTTSSKDASSGNRRRR